jgi:hypothetical protein
MSGLRAAFLVFSSQTYDLRQTSWPIEPETSLNENSVMALL